MRGPIFSGTSDFKEIAVDGRAITRALDDKVAEEWIANEAASISRAPRAAGHAEQVRETLTAGEKATALRLAIERDRARDDAPADAAEDEVRRAILTAAIDVLPPWRFRVFAAWFRGINRHAIARELDVSVSTVRSALDGEGLKRAGPGALNIITNALRDSADFRKVVAEMATKKQKENTASARVLGWFKGIDNKPELIVPLAMLLVMDDLKDSKNEVQIADIQQHFPRAGVSQCLALLRAHAFVSNNGRTAKIVRTPISKEQA